MVLRVARPEDAGMIREIYAPYVDGSTVSFELDVPSEEEMRTRMAGCLARFPWLVAEDEGKVVGYAYAFSYRERKAYQWCVETSVYVDEPRKGTGVAAALYDELFRILTGQGFHTAYAVITLPNPASVRFHEKMGFRSFADYRSVGFKLGSWHDVHWMEKRLNEGRPAGDPIPFPEWQRAQAVRS